jgi:large conductance mechanosensitive channel
MKNTVREFRTFLLRGNVVDLAVGVVIGAAFGAVVNSLVKDILTPLIAAIGGSPDFSRLSWKLGSAEINYGNFLNALIAFLIVATVIFFVVVKPINALTARANRGKETEPETRACPECLSVIPREASRCKFCGTKVQPQK